MSISYKESMIRDIRNRIDETIERHIDYIEYCSSEACRDYQDGFIDGYYAAYRDLIAPQVTAEEDEDE